jgi:hypothetical protein
MPGQAGKRLDQQPRRAASPLLQNTGQNALTLPKLFLTRFPEGALVLGSETTAPRQGRSIVTWRGIFCDAALLCADALWTTPEDLNQVLIEAGCDLAGGHVAVAVRINNSGLIAGHYVDASGVERLCLCDPTTGGLWYWNISLPFSIRDLNGDGTVVGNVLNDADEEQGFLWSPFRQNGFLLMPVGYRLSGINDHGVVVGIIDGRRTSEAFRCEFD